MLHQGCVILGFRFEWPSMRLTWLDVGQVYFFKHYKRSNVVVNKMPEKILFFMFCVIKCHGNHYACDNLTSDPINIWYSSPQRLSVSVIVDNLNMITQHHSDNCVLSVCNYKCSLILSKNPKYCLSHFLLFFASLSYVFLECGIS